MLRRAALVLVIFCFIAGCGGAPVVGVFLPTTGETSTYGEAVESGMRLALNEARELGSLPPKFEVIWKDTESDPKKAIDLYKQLVNDRGARIVVGGATSAEAIELIPFLDEMNIICISPSASAPGLAEKSRLFYRVYPSDELEGHTAGQFLFERLRVSKVVLYTGNSEYTRGIEPEFRRRYEENLGGEIVTRINLHEDNWQTAAAKTLKETGIEAVCIIGYAEEILEVLRHLREQKYTGRILTTSAFFSSKIIKEAGDLADGVLFPLPPFDRTSEKEPTVSFVHNYMDMYQRAPDVFAAHGYDTMKLIIKVLSDANPPETPELSKALHFGLGEFMGVTGPILFDDYGDVKHYPKMFIVKDGQVLSYQRYLKTERARIHGDLQNLLVSGN